MRTATVTAIILGLASAAATAEPAREETTGRVSYNERAPARPPVTERDDAGWIELASATPASHGREFIVVGADAGALLQLRVAAATGRPGIQAVRVDYVDGGHKSFAIARALTRRHPAILDLRGPREVRQVVVIADRASRGSYTVSARPGTTGIALR